jgi:hypothetical protein
MELRDVYVLNWYSRGYGYDFINWKCLGIYNTLSAAKRDAVRLALQSIESFNVYDPAKRFHQRTRSKFWDDQWNQMLGVDLYTIETRQLDSDAISSETLHFNLDEYIKRHIAERRMSSEEARTLLIGWKNDPPYATLLELFSTDEVYYHESSREHVEEWLSHYGSFPCDYNLL